MSFALQWVSCRQRVIGSHFPPICYSVSFGALSLLTFDVIIDSYVFIAILNLVLSLILCFFFVPFFFYFSFCGMMIFSHIMLMFFFFNLLYAFDLRLLCQICKPLSISTYLRLVVSIGSNTFWGKKIYIFLLSTPKFHDFDVLFYIFFFFFLLFIVVITVTHFLFSKSVYWLIFQLWFSLSYGFLLLF